MHQFRDSEHYSVMDSIESETRLLWFELGRQQNPERVRELQEAIRDKVQTMKALRPYERHAELCTKEVKARLMLQ